MYAIIETGGKQYKVTAGDILSVERLETEVGKTITFVPLMLADESNTTFGNPLVSNASVSATVLEHGKGKKVLTAVYKKMNGHHRAQGHRQPYSKIKIDAIKK